jgi:hypothetical protein
MSPRTAVPLTRLDLGESQAIALASELGGAVVLIDELAGRQEATRRGLKVAGTLSVLDDADRAGLGKFDEAIVRCGQPVFAYPKPSWPKLSKSGPAEALSFSQTLHVSLLAWSPFRCKAKPRQFLKASPCP